MRTMRTNRVTKPNGSKIQGNSFQKILNQMMKLTSGGNLRVANKHWNIYGAGQTANNSNYNNIVGS